MSSPYRSPGAEAIAEERLRQILGEKYESELDDVQWTHSELVHAAVAYAQPPNTVYGRTSDGGKTWDQVWPKTWTGKKDERNKHSHLRRLIIAGALLAAEIDRLLIEQKET